MLGMIDPRNKQLAEMLINYSTRSTKGDLVFIHCNGYDTLQLGAAILEAAVKAGAAPYIQFSDGEIQRRLVSQADEGVFKRLGQYELKQMKDATVYIGIRGSDNSFEMSDVPRAQLDLYSKHVVKPVHLEQRVKHTRWVVMRYPNSAMAQMAQMSTEAFGDFYYRVCLVDYAKMAEAVKPLQKLMNKTDKVTIKGPGTDVTFSIKGIGSVPCCGEMNIPDGECFTAPVKNSLNGTVQFNAPTLQEGSPYENIKLRFEKGKIVEATAANAEQTAKLNTIFDRDPGSRYLGEFSLGFNPFILDPMRDILFDEKVAGSFHMAVGNAYQDANNGNKSALHWDLVCIQRPEYGGGEIYFDDKLIRKDGEFVLKELKGLNRDSLGAE